MARKALLVCNPLAGLSKQSEGWLLLLVFLLGVVAWIPTSQPAAVNNPAALSLIVLLYLTFIYEMNGDAAGGVNGNKTQEWARERERERERERKTQTQPLGFNFQFASERNAEREIIAHPLHI
jgi:hypothetical protein